MDDALSFLLGADNERRLAAEEKCNILKASQPNIYILSLASSMRSNTNPSCRALAAVLLRGTAITESVLWTSLSVEDVHYIRHNVLENLLHEELFYVQRQIANLTIALTRLGDWPELFDGVLFLAQSSLEHKKLSMHILDKLIGGKSISFVYFSLYWLIFSFVEFIRGLAETKEGYLWQLISSALFDANLELQLSGSCALCSLLLECAQVSHKD